MNIFEASLSDYFGCDNLNKILNVKVGIAGLGGLGSNCAFNLVRSGFKKFVLCDFDKVETKNLNRQFYFMNQAGLLKTEALKSNLLNINPELELELVPEKLDEYNIGVVFKDCDVVVEGFDDILFKQMIATRYSRSGKFFVSASGLAGWGNSDKIVTRMIHDKFYVVGDGVSGVSVDNPPCSPRVNIAAAKQADCILSWVLGTK